MVVEEPVELCDVLLGAVVEVPVCGVVVVVDPLAVEEPEAGCGAVLVLSVEDEGVGVGAGAAAGVLVVVAVEGELVVVVGVVLCDAVCGAVACCVVLGLFEVVEDAAGALVEGAGAVLVEEAGAGLVVAVAAGAGAGCCVCC